MEKINAIATEKMELMESTAVTTMTSTLDFSYSAKLSLQQRIDPIATMPTFQNNGKTV